MSSWWPTFSPNPADQAVINAARMNHEHREYAEPRSRVTSWGSKIVTATVAAEAATRVYDHPVTQKVVHVVADNTQKVVHTVAENIPNVVKETASQTKETVQEAAGSVFSTMGEYLGHLKSAYGWASWGFSWLPGSVKIVVLGAGVIGAYQFYNWVRYPQGYAGSATVNSNVNVHLNMPQIPAHCKPVVETTTAANGDKNVRVGLDCTDPNITRQFKRVAIARELEDQFHELQQGKLSRQDKKDIEAIIRRLHDAPNNAKTIADADALLKEKVQGVKDTHQKLINAKNLELPEALKNAVENLCQRFDELKAQSYVHHDINIRSDEAKALLERVSDHVKLEALHKSINEIVATRLTFIKGKGSKHLKEDIESWKDRLDKKEVDDVHYTLQQVEPIVALANKRIEGYLGRKVIHKMQNNR